MACNPGSPCFGGGIVIGPSVPINCGVIDLCATPRSITDLVSYNGPALTCSGINTCDNLTVALQKLDDKVCIQNIFNEFITYITNNQEVYDIFCSSVNGCIPVTTTTTTTNPCHCLSFVYPGICIECDESKIEYIDCNGTSIIGNVVQGDPAYQDCGHSPTADNVNVVITEGTGCTTCLYFVFPITSGTLTANITYTDCFGTLYEEVIEKNSINIYCGLTPTCDVQDVIIIESGESCVGEEGARNCGNCNCHSISNPGTSPVAFSYIECSAISPDTYNYITDTIRGGENIVVCAAPGSVTVPVGIVVTDLGTTCIIGEQSC